MFKVLFTSLLPSISLSRLIALAIYSLLCKHSVTGLCLLFYTSSRGIHLTTVYTLTRIESGRKFGCASRE